MAFRNHRRRIRAYRRSGRMFADSLSCGGLSDLHAERQRLALRYAELGLKGHNPQVMSLNLLRQVVTESEAKNRDV